MDDQVHGVRGSKGRGTLEPPMAKRTRHPLKSFFMFIVVCGIAYFAYQNRHLFTGNVQEHLSQDEREEIRDKVVLEFQKYPEFYTVRSMSWRPRESRYRIDIEVDDATENARDICFEIAHFVEVALLERRVPDLAVGGQGDGPGLDQVDPAGTEAELAVEGADDVDRQLLEVRPCRLADLGEDVDLLALGASAVDADRRR